MTDTTRLILPLIAAAQAQKHVTHNEAVLKLDGLVQLNALSYTTSAEPGSPTDGDIYLLPAGKTGTDWGGFTNHNVAHYYDGVWHSITPAEGWLCFVRDTDTLYYFSGTSWKTLLVTAAGSFTPTYKGSTGDPSCTYDVQSGVWFRILDLVFFTLDIRTDTASGGSGNLLIALTGAPTMAGDQTIPVAGAIAWSPTAPTKMTTNSGSVNLTLGTNAGNLTTSALQNVANANRVQAQGFYSTS